MTEDGIISIKKKESIHTHIPMGQKPSFASGFNINISFIRLRNMLHLSWKFDSDHFHQSINSQNEIEPTEIAEYTSYN